MKSINHVALVVDDLEEACRFYEREFGLEPLPAFQFDYPAAFFRINAEQQLHVTEWEDSTSFRGHFCVLVDDFTATFRRMKELGVIDVKPWGRVRKLPDGSMQMFVRDPSGNLVECCGAPDAEVDEAIFEDDLVESEPGMYVSGRNDGRGYQSADATLHHE